MCMKCCQRQAPHQMTWFRHKTITEKLQNTAKQQKCEKDIKNCKRQ